LRDEDKKRLKNSVLRAFIVQQLDPSDDTSMYHIFERLNTGGTLLTNQEIRNCVYHGTFIEFLDRLNKERCWRDILGKDSLDTHKKDIELLIRFFSMRDITAYRKPMKDFLSRYMKKNKNPSQDVLNNSEQIFHKTCALIVDKLGKKPFHIRSGLNAAVFDAVMVAFSNHIDAVPEDITDRYQQLIADKAFSDNTKQSTTDVDTVRQRFDKANTILFG
jgi:hypothetical protein